MRTQFAEYINPKRAMPEWSWARSKEEQPSFVVVNGVKVYPPMFAEGYFEIDMAFVQGG